MSKMEIECIRSLKKNLAHENEDSLEDIITVVNPSLGERVLLLGNIKNIGKYIRKMGAEVKILQCEDQALDTTNYLLNESCEFISGNIDNMPFKDEYFDKVIFLESFNSFKDEKRVLKEIVRVLRKSGQLLIKENDCNCMSYKVESIKSMIRGEYCKYYNPDELSNKLRDYGLDGTVETVTKKKYIYLGTKIS